MLAIWSLVPLPRALPWITFRKFPGGSVQGAYCIPGQGTKTLHAAHSRKNTKNKSPKQKERGKKNTRIPFYGIIGESGDMCSFYSQLGKFPQWSLFCNPCLLTWNLRFPYPLCWVLYARCVENLLWAKCFKMQLLLLFSYGAVNRSGDDWWEKVVCYRSQKNRGMPGPQSHLGKHQGQLGGDMSRKWAGAFIVSCVARNRARSSGLGLATLNNFKVGTGLWGIGVVPDCLIPGPGVIRAGEWWSWMRKLPGGGGGCVGLWIGCLVCKRHTCRQVCYLLKSASPGKGSPSSVDKALGVKASEFKQCLIYQAKLNVYVIPIPVITLMKALLTPFLMEKKWNLRKV